MSGSSIGGVLAALTLGAVVISAAQGSEPADPSAPGGDVILGVHSPGSRGELTHYAYCGAPGTEPAAAEYEVQIGEGLAYDENAEGKPCPDGPREPTAMQENPGLYEEMSRGQQEPLEFAGGDRAKPCGTWEASTVEAARQLAAECGPLTRGQL